MRIDPTAVKFPPANFEAYERLGKECRAYYNMNPYPFFHFSTWLTERKGPLPKCLPLAKNVIDKGARWLFGKGIRLACETDTMLQDEVAEIWRKNRMPSKLHHLGKLGGKEGGVCLKFSVVDGEVKINVLSAVEEVKFYLNPHDQTDVVLARVEYPYMDLSDGGWHWYREDWTPEEVYYYKPVKLETSPMQKNPYYYSITPYKPNVAMFNWEIDRVEKNAFGVIPIHCIKNFESPTGYGHGDLFDLTRTIDRINLVYHLMDISNQRDADPTKVFFDVDAENDDLLGSEESGGVLSLKSDETETGEPKTGRVELLEAKGLLRAPMELYAKDMKAMLFEATGMVFTRPEDITNKGNLTQSVLVQLYAPVIEVTNEKRKNYGEEGISRFLGLMCQGLKNFGMSEFKRYNSEKHKIDIVWPDYFRMSADEKLAEVDRYKIEVESGLITRKEALKRIAVLEEIETVEEFVKELENWEDPNLELKRQTLSASKPIADQVNDDRGDKHESSGTRVQKSGTRVRDVT